MVGREWVAVPALVCRTELVFRCLQSHLTPPLSQLVKGDMIRRGGERGGGGARLAAAAPLMTDGRSHGITANESSPRYSLSTVQSREKKCRQEEKRITL